MSIWGVMGQTRERTSVGPGVSWSGASSVTTHLPSTAVGRGVEGGKAGTGHSALMDLGPDQEPPGSSGAVTRGERSPSWGRWVSEGQGAS